MLNFFFACFIWTSFFFAVCTSFIKNLFYKYKSFLNKFMSITTSSFIKIEIILSFFSMPTPNPKKPNFDNPLLTFLIMICLFLCIFMYYHGGSLILGDTPFIYIIFAFLQSTLLDYFSLSPLFTIYTMYKNGIPLTTTIRDLLISKFKIIIKNRIYEYLLIWFRKNILINKVMVYLNKTILPLINKVMVYLETICAKIKKYANSIYNSIYNNILSFAMILANSRFNTWPIKISLYYIGIYYISHSNFNYITVLGLIYILLSLILQISTSIKYYSDKGDSEVVAILVPILGILLLSFSGIFILALFKLAVKRSIFTPSPPRESILQHISRLQAGEGKPGGGGGPGGPSGEGPLKRKRDEEDSSGEGPSKRNRAEEGPEDEGLDFQFFHRKTVKNSRNMPEGIDPEDVESSGYGPGYGIYNTPPGHFLRNKFEIPSNITRHSGPCKIVDAIEDAKTYEKLRLDELKKPDIQRQLSRIVDKKARLNAEQKIMNNLIDRLSPREYNKADLRIAVNEYYEIWKLAMKYPFDKDKYKTHANYFFLIQEKYFKDKGNSKLSANIRIMYWSLLKTQQFEVKGRSDGFKTVEFVYTEDSAARRRFKDYLKNK